MVASSHLRWICAVAIPLIFTACGVSDSPSSSTVGAISETPPNASAAGTVTLGSPAQAESSTARSGQKTYTSAQTKFPDPGPYKLVTRTENGKDVEYWQGRFKQGTYGGSITLSTFGNGPKTFNVWEASDADSHGYGILLFDVLVDVDPWSGKSYPKLAKSVTVSENNLEYTFVLRKGLKWSDGHPITADDVVFTFGKLVAEGYGNSSLRDTLSVFGQYPSVEKVDELTVKFKTKKVFAPFLNALTSIPVAPKHVIEPIIKGSKGHDNFHSFWSVNTKPESMVTSGPLKLSRYVASQRVELVRNPSYSMVDSSGKTLPYLDKFIVAIVPDQNTQLLKFYGGELDFLDIRSVRGQDAALMKQKEKTDNFSMYNLGPDDGKTFFAFNMNRRNNKEKGNKPYVDPIKQKWFNNINFRRACSHAINRDRLINNVMRGVGLPSYGPESTAAVFFNKNLKEYPQELAYSEKLLKDGGFVKKGDRLYDSDGHPVEFTLITNAGNSARDGTCIQIVEDLKQLGMKVHYQPIDFNIMIDKTHNSLDWETVVMGLTGDKIEPYSGANVWKSDGRLHIFDQRLPDKTGKVIVADARDWEKQIDSCFDEGAVTLDDAERHKFFDQYQQIVYDQCPYVYLFSILDITAIRNTVKNYCPTPLRVNYTPKGSLHNIEEIYIEKGGQK